MSVINTARVRINRNSIWAYGLGVALFAAIPPLWRLPMQAAQALADGAERSRWVVPGYILGVFFVVPGLVFGAQALFATKSPEVLEAEHKEAVYEAVKKEIEELDHKQSRKKTAIETSQVQL